MRGVVAMGRKGKQKGKQVARCLPRRAWQGVVESKKLNPKPVSAVGNNLGMMENCACCCCCCC